jgi:hypothetical protein
MKDYGSLIADLQLVFRHLGAVSVTSNCARLVLSSATVVSLAFALIAPSFAATQTEESVARMCVGTAGAWAINGDKYVPEFAGKPPAQRGVESYWRHSYRGVSVPVPMNTDGWGFYFGDSNYLKNLVGMSNNELNISYGFVPSQVPTSIEAAGDIAAEFGLPAANLEPMDLVRLALTIDPDSVMCDTNNVQETVNDLAAVYVKALLLSHHDKAYLHEEGALGHSVMEIGERWTYLFEDKSGRLNEIQLRHENPGLYPYIGFEINDKVLMDSMYSHPWMALFFEAASEQTRDRIERLRESVIDHSLSEDMLKNLDEKLAEFDSPSTE